MEVVSMAWSTSVTGSPSYVWEKKLKATKSSLEDWLKNTSKILPIPSLVREKRLFNS